MVPLLLPLLLQLNKKIIIFYTFLYFALFEDLGGAVVSIQDQNFKLILIWVF